MSKRPLSTLFLGLLFCLLSTFCVWAQVQIGGRALVSLEGNVRRLAEKDLLVQTAPARVLRFRLPARTEFLGKDGKPIRDSLIHPGDRIRIEVNSGDLETAVYVFFLTPGSTVEQEAASTSIQDSAVTAPEPGDFAVAQPSARVESTDSPSRQPANLPGTENATGKSKINPVDRQRYLWIPPGMFTMGCSVGDTECYPNEKPSHLERIASGFWLGQTEVTQAAYQHVTGANPSSKKGDQLPVESVTLADAANYCRAIGGRLPTEAEWEFAARAGTAESRYGGVDQVAWYRGNSGGSLHPVGRKQPNAFGLFDMLGNVWEYVDVGASSSLLNLRGGNAGMDSRLSRASTRGLSETADSRSNGRGFRCVENTPTAEPAPVPAVASVSTVGGVVVPPRPIKRFDPEYSEEARKAKLSISALLVLSPH